MPETAMTRKQALAEARKRWGPMAIAWYDKTSRRGGWYSVGVSGEPWGLRAYGRSPFSYDRAFAEADRREVE